MATQEKNYFILPVEENRLIFAITARDTEVEKPIMLYDGGQHALFYRDSKDVVILDYLDKRATPMLLTGQDVAIAEIDPDTEKMIRQYPVKVKIVSELPEFNLK